MKRFTIFAGPNGSGKSTIIKSVTEHLKVAGPHGLGAYVNADEIAISLVGDSFYFRHYNLKAVRADQLLGYITSSGLQRNLNINDIKAMFHLAGGRILLKEKQHKDFIAQILSNFMVDQMLRQGKECCMETVFSHESKLGLMRLARGLGYEVTLYFVATEDPEINKDRVDARVKNNGHRVPHELIEKRYYRALDLLHPSTLEADQTVFWDNSGNEARRIATCTKKQGRQVLKDYDETTAPRWFIKYYINKIPDHKP